MTEQTLPPTNQTVSPSTSVKWWSQAAIGLLVIVELCWVLPWFRMVMQVTVVAPMGEVGLVLGGIMLAAYGLGLAMGALRLMHKIQLIGFTVFLLASLWLAEKLLLVRPAFEAVNGLARLDPGAVLALFFVIWMWQRGLTLAQDVLRPITVWRRFELGLLIFMAYLFIAAQLDFYRPSFGVFVLFLFCGLMAVAFARVSYVGMSKGVTKNPFDLRWSVSLSGTLGATVALAALFGTLLTGQYRLLLDFLAEAIKLLIAVAIFVLGIPGLLISFLITPLVPWLQAAVSGADVTSTMGELFRQLKLPEDRIETPLPISFQALCFWGLIILLVVVLVLRMRKAFITRRNTRLYLPEDLLKRGEAREIIRRAVQEALNGLFGRLRPARRFMAAARIRRIYAQLMDLSAELKHPRPEAATPYEFLPQLGELFSARTEDLRLITEAYVRVRYGEIPEDPIEIEAVEKAWQQILEEGQRLKRAGAAKLQTAEIKEIERGGV